MFWNDAENSEERVWRTLRFPSDGEQFRSVNENSG
jgi:hypothetical protein